MGTEIHCFKQMWIYPWDSELLSVLQYHLSKNVQEYLCRFFLFASWTAQQYPIWNLKNKFTVDVWRYLGSELGRWGVFCLFYNGLVFFYELYQAIFFVAKCDWMMSSPDWERESSFLENLAILLHSLRQVSKQLPIRSKSKWKVKYVHENE